jgi:hypothetical protein
VGRGTIVQVWASLAATLLALGGAFLATLATSSHPRGYQVLGDPIFYVGVVSLAVGVYILLKLFAFPRLWLPEIKTRLALSVTSEPLEIAGLPNNIAIIHVTVVNNDRESITDTLVNALVPPPVLSIHASNPQGAIHPSGHVQDAPEGKVWINHGVTLPGHGTVGQYFFRLELPPGEVDFALHFTLSSSDMPNKIELVSSFRHIPGEPVEGAAS